MKQMWVDSVSEEDAAGELKEFYERVKAPDGSVGGIYKVLSLRPKVAIENERPMLEGVGGAKPGTGDVPVEGIRAIT